MFFTLGIIVSHKNKSRPWQTTPQHTAAFLRVDSRKNYCPQELQKRSHWLQCLCNSYVSQSWIIPLSQNFIKLDGYRMASSQRITINMPLSFITISNHCNHTAHVHFYIFSGDKVIKEESLDKMGLQNVNNHDFVLCETTVSGQFLKSSCCTCRPQMQSMILCGSFILLTLSCVFLAFVNTCLPITCSFHALPKQAAVGTHGRWEAWRPTAHRTCTLCNSPSNSKFL